MSESTIPNNVLNLAEAPLPEFSDKQKLEELEKLLPRLALVARIAEKMYRWAARTNKSIPPDGWEELRVALGLPPPEQPKLIVAATAIPVVDKRRR